MEFNNLKTIDFKKIFSVIKSNYDKDAGLFTVVLILIIFFGIKQFLIPALTTFTGNLAKVQAKQQELKTYLEKEQMLLSPESQQSVENLPIKVYKSPYSGMDAESASAEIIQELIRLIKETGKARINQIDFSSEKITDDNGAESNNYSVLTLNISMEAPYESIQNLLTNIYLMKYLVVIKKIECSSKDSFESLDTNLSLDIYVKTTDSPDDAG